MMPPFKPPFEPRTYQFLKRLKWLLTRHRHNWVVEPGIILACLPLSECTGNWGVICLPHSGFPCPSPDFMLRVPMTREQAEVALALQKTGNKFHPVKP